MYGPDLLSFVQIRQAPTDFWLSAFPLNAFSLREIVAVLLSLIIISAGCTGDNKDKAPHPRRAVNLAKRHHGAKKTGANSRGGPARKDILVAKINNTPLFRADVEDYIATGLDREAAEKSAIRDILLLQEARRRGLRKQESFKRAQEGILAKELIMTRFLENYSSDDIPERLVEKSYKLNLLHYQRPETVTVLNMLVVSGRKKSPEHRRRAEKIARSFHRTVRDALHRSGHLSEARLRALTQAQREKTPPRDSGGDSIEIKSEIVTTPRRGYTLAAFADAAFALKKPGMVSPIVETHYGYHLIYLKERNPARNIPYSAATKDIRKRILNDARGHETTELIKTLKRRYRVEIDEDAFRLAFANPVTSDPHER